MLGIRKVKFFGYECEKGSFRIDEQRRSDIQAIPPPITRKGMQSLLGTVVICSGFIADYSTRAIPLYNMTTSSYDWSNAWSEKEIAALNDIKQAVIDSCSLCDITARTVLLYVLFCLSCMYCPLYVLYILHTVHTVHGPCLPVPDVDVSPSTSVHTLIHT